MSEALTLKYRPSKFKDVVGQAKVVESLAEVLKNGRARSFLLTGPSGTGKTTLARIIAKKLGCNSANLVEIDAATYNGIDDMRSIAETMTYQGMGGSSVRVAIVDEAHALSAAAWKALLKPIEEPPAHAAWVLCTTDIEKVPEMIRNRCARYDLQPVEDADIEALLERVAAAESMTVVPEVLAVIAEKSQGSPRRALSALSTCAAAKTRKEALELLREVSIDEADVAGLCRFLLWGKPRTWEAACALLAKMDTRNPEGLRIVISNYNAKVALAPKSDADCNRALLVLRAFGAPYPAQSGVAPLVLSLARVIFAE